MAFDPVTYQRDYDALLATCEAAVRRAITEALRYHYDAELTAKLATNAVFFTLHQRHAFIELPDRKVA